MHAPLNTLIPSFTPRPQRGRLSNVDYRRRLIIIILYYNTILLYDILSHPVHTRILARSALQLRLPDAA